MRTQVYDELTGSRIPPNARRWKGETRTSVTLPAKTATEQELDALNLKIARQQTELYPIQLAYQFPELALQGGIEGLSLTPQLQAELQELIGSKTAERELYSLAGDRIKKYLAGEMLLTPAEQKELDVLYGAQRDIGTREIEEFGRTLAASRGLNLADTPAAAAVLREKRNLETGLGAAKAGATLDFAGRQGAFASAIAQFQNSLKQQAAMNRMGLGQYSTTALPLARDYFSERAAQPTQFSKYTPSTMDWINTGIGFMTGLGSLATGGARMWSAGAGSKSAGQSAWT